jgi:hypothetical protein
MNKLIIIEGDMTDLEFSQIVMGFKDYELLNNEVNQTSLNKFRDMTDQLRC